MKVLMIDDERDIRTVAKASLEGVGGFETKLAASAREGFEILAYFRADIILMDMMMPCIDGLQAMAQLKADKKLREIPVIFVSAKVQRSEIYEYLAAGAIGVIRKPFDPMTFPAEIESILSNPHQAS